MKMPTLIEGWKQLSSDHLENKISDRDLCNRFTNLVWIHEEQPRLGHFIECDKDNKPLEEPESLKTFHESGPEGMEAEKTARKEWNEAVSRVRWEGWSIDDDNRVLRNRIALVGYYRDDEFEFIHKTYGQIIDSNIPLEPTKEYAITLHLNN